MAKRCADLVLGIESSCDETAAAVVRAGREVLSTIVESQIAEHLDPAKMTSSRANA